VGAIERFSMLGEVVGKFLVWKQSYDEFLALAPVVIQRYLHQLSTGHPRELNVPRTLKTILHME
jgi:hypothetical protein